MNKETRKCKICGNTYETDSYTRKYCYECSPYYSRDGERTMTRGEAVNTVPQNVGKTY